MTRCPYRYVSLMANQLTDNQCFLEENHTGQHIKREIFPPPQQSALFQEGWIKPSFTKVTDGSTTKDRKCLT